MHDGYSLRVAARPCRVGQCSMSGQLPWTWAWNTTELRALEISSGRIRPPWYAITCDG